MVGAEKLRCSANPGSAFTLRPRCEFSRLRFGFDTIWPMALTIQYINKSVIILNRWVQEIPIRRNHKIIISCDIDPAEGMISFDSLPLTKVYFKSVRLFLPLHRT